VVFLIAGAQVSTVLTVVVLPFALALPAGWENTVVVIRVQSLVELFGMFLYLVWIPRYLFVAPSSRLDR
jgi:hypothetical protein